MLGGKTSNSSLSSTDYAPIFTIPSFLQLHELATIIIAHFMEEETVRSQTAQSHTASDCLI